LTDYIRDLRARIGNMKVVVPGVRALIVDERRRLLLHKRADFLTWALPAGVVDRGDSAFTALEREVKEEVGLDVLQAIPFGVYTHPKYSVEYPNGDQVQTFTIAFAVSEWSGTPKADGDEALEVGFFDFDALPRPLHSIHEESIEDYRSYDGAFIVK